MYGGQILVSSDQKKPSGFCCLSQDHVMVSHSLSLDAQVENV